MLERIAPVKNDQPRNPSKGEAATVNRLIKAEMACRKVQMDAARAMELAQAKLATASAELLSYAAELRVACNVPPGAQVNPDAGCIWAQADGSPALQPAGGATVLPIDGKHNGTPKGKRAARRAAAHPAADG